ncbi:unannotated protein [freshwater metagenome]|uniref:Unannotated protein n=1 Tax=freshwater metagenome TaxID=449393 RepID=A0A6J7J423_9ZZZZ
MGVLDDIVDALGAARIPGEPALLAELVELLDAPREHLVDIRLMPGIPDHDVLGRLEDAVQRNGQLDDPEVRAEVATGGRYLLNEEGPDLLRQRRHLLDRQGTDIVGIADSAEQTHPRSLPGKARSGA